MRGLVLAAVAALAATAAAAELPAGESWPVDAHTTGWLVSDARAPLVTLHLEFPVGSWSAWARSSGADRAFALQLHDPAGRLRREADRLGLDPIVRVGRRAATLRVTCSSAELEQTVDWLRRVLASEQIDRDAVRRRAREQRLGFRFAMKTPRFRARREHARLLFESGDPRLRPFEMPRRVERSALELTRARDRVVRMPGRLVALAGDLDLARAKRVAASLLPPPVAESLPEQPRDLPQVRSTRAGGDDVDISLDRLTQVYFSYGRESIALDHPDYPAFLVANHVLGGHFYSRLYRALRHQAGETYGAFSTDHGDVATNLYALTTFTRTANAERTEDKLRAELARFHRDGITQVEAADAIGFLRGRLEFTRQSPTQQLDRALRERRLGLKPGFLDGQVDRAAKLDLAEINAFVERFFDPERFVMVRVGPPD